MDFNQSFQMYDTIEGANCQPMLPLVISQKEAAIDAVKKSDCAKPQRLIRHGLVEKRRSMIC